MPKYRVEIHGDGGVEYTGELFVSIRGTHRARIPQSDLQELVQAFRAAKFFSQAQEYQGSLTDLPTYTITLAFDDVQKSLIDKGASKFPGLPPDLVQESNMAAEITQLENLIDHTAGTEQWICGNEDTVPSLQEEKFDFNAPDAEHLSILANVAECGSARVVEDLLKVGAPVESRNIRDRQTALVIAAQRGNLEMVKALLSAGAGTSKSEKDQALQIAAESGASDASGAFRESRACKGNFRTAAGFGCPGQTWQNGAHALGPRPDEGIDRAEVARMLLKAGAKINVSDKAGNTPLMEVHFDVSAARALVQAGANVNARNTEGWTPLNHASSPEMAESFLESGADPFARDNSGISVLEHAKHFSSAIARVIEAAQQSKRSR
jgi:ankyrin repeat protein